MQLLFPANKQTELSFKVGIGGTSSTPQSVHVVLERDSTILSYVASVSGDEWKVIIENPGKVFSNGEVKMSVNVLLNNRLFTPMKSVADIVDGINIPPETKQDDPVQQPEIEEPAIQKSLLMHISAQESVEPKKKIISPTIKPQHKKPTKLNQPLIAVKETVEVISPVKMQLLKSIEPGNTLKTVRKVIESAPPVSKESPFKLKKSKIVYK